MGPEFGSPPAPLIQPMIKDHVVTLRVSIVHVKDTNRLMML